LKVYPFILLTHLGGASTVAQVFRNTFQRLRPRKKAVMTRLGVCFSLAGLLAAASAFAADVTRIASSAEEDDPFGMFLNAQVERTQQRSIITREAQVPGVDVRELSYQWLDTRLNAGAQIGLYQDLEFHFNVPVVFQQDARYRFASGNSAATSTISNNCLAPNGTLLNASCLSTGAGANPLFNVPTDTYARGLGNISFGLAYAIFNERKDDTKPMWVVGFDWVAPTAQRYDPSVSTTSSAPGFFGDKTHKYVPYTALSKKFGPVEPYVKFSWAIPYRGPGTYSNCEHPEIGMAYPQNCGTADWPVADAGMRAPHVIEVLFGTDLIADEDPAMDQKFGFDVRGIARYVSKGRYENELSDVLNKLLATGDYMQLGGRLGVIAKPAKALSLRLGASFLYNTEHTLTDEILGRDSASDADSQVEIPQVPGGAAPEVNPNFDFRTDMVGRRFRVVDNYSFILDAMISLEF
jgi:hypothetical protein